MKANDAMFCIWKEPEQRGRLEIVSRKAYLASGGGSDCTHTMGAVYAKWHRIPDAKIMECVLWMGFELVEEYDIPVKEVTKELEKIEGFTDYWNRIGNRCCALF
jgi:hypothetical protein